MRNNKNAVGILGALTVLVLALCVLPFASATTSTTSDTVRSRIEQKLQADGLQNISVTIEGGNVILEGSVPTLADKLRAGRMAMGKDVAGVTNNLTLEDSHRTDAQVVADVGKSIGTYFYYDTFDWVSGTLNNGVVTLIGWAREPWHKDDYQQRVEAIPGVRQVVNQIRVLPVSTFDDQLRHRVARLIYRHPTLSRYGVGAYPAIHVIVENGRVSLEGVVDSAAAQSVAGMLAHQSNAFKITNQLQVESGS